MALTVVVVWALINDDDDDDDDDDEDDDDLFLRNSWPKEGLNPYFQPVLP